MATSTRSPAKKAIDEARFVLLGKRQHQLVHFKRLGALVCRNRNDIAHILHRTTRRTLWIAGSSEATNSLLSVLRSSSLREAGDFLALKTPEPSAIPALQSYFERVVGVGADFQFLPDEELVDVLVAPADERRDLFIGGRVDSLRGLVVLLCGDLQQVVIPLASFVPNERQRPDPDHFRLTDYGGTVCLGDYEASSHSILYETDPDYRRRYRAKRAAEDKTFGASLARLRRLKGLAREDFSPLSAKEIARIERNEIVEPHPNTLRTIAARLGVEPDEIKSF